MTTGLAWLPLVQTCGVVVVEPSRIRLMLAPFCTPHNEASSCSASPVTSDSLSVMASTAVSLLLPSVDLQQTDRQPSSVARYLDTHAATKYENNKWFCCETSWLFIREQGKETLNTRRTAPLAQVSNVACGCTFHVQVNKTRVCVLRSVNMRFGTSFWVNSPKRQMY